MRPSFLRLWEAAHALTEADLTIGRRWYRDARTQLDVRAKLYGIPEPVVVAAAATLTPGLRWDRTLRLLDTLLEAADMGHPMPVVGDATFGFRDRRKAWLTLRTGDTSHCTGPKVEPFEHALNGDESAIVVDRHMVRLAVGLDVRQLHDAAMDRIRASLWTVAWAMREQPAHLQAALWTVGAKPLDRARADPHSGPDGGQSAG